TMTSAALAIRLTCLLLGEIVWTTAVNLSSSVGEESGFVSVQSGQSLILKCFYEGNVAARIYWYKQVLGQKPRLISTFYLFDRNGTFHGAFKGNQRFSLDTQNGKNHLTITDLRVSDSATYYCINCYLSALEILESTIVSVQGSGLNVPAVVHQLESETNQPGGSVKRSVYWFKNSEESHPGLIYTQGGRNDQCERNVNSQTHTCAYNLPMKNLNLSHIGTYYCAVASCGHILFGNGTKLDLEDSSFWMVAVTLTSMLSALLAFTVCMMKKRNSRHSPGRTDYQNTHHLYYAALNLTRSRAQRDPTWSECVYHGLRK
uniref:Ig-like domain-containing protein n=1 Tax=Labrus bergylta TaxID=56723 RepID=A0A3Q3DZT8_9LABR